MTTDEGVMRVVAAPGERPRVGDNVALAVDEARLHRFDPETGERIE